MKIQLSQKLKDIHGNPLKNGDDEVRLSTIFIDSLLANFTDEKDLPGQVKVSRFVLAQEIQRKKEGTIDLSLEDATLLKTLVGKAYGTLIVGQVWEILK